VGVLSCLGIDQWTRPKMHVAAKIAAFVLATVALVALSSPGAAVARCPRLRCPEVAGHFLLPLPTRCFRRGSCSRVAEPEPDQRDATTGHERTSPGWTRPTIGEVRTG
jgi:hypothetical protein